MKPHIKRKQGQYWIFSSKSASLDCMPQYKCKSVGMVKWLVRNMDEVKNPAKNPAEVFLMPGLFSFSRI